jgi:hypothetical protein
MAQARGLSFEALRTVRPEMNGQSPASGLDCCLEPAPAAIKTAAEKQYEYDYYQKCRRVHDGLLRKRENAQV